MMPKFSEQGVCANCGSGDVELFRMERGASVLLWFECHDCGCEYIEAYDYSAKGIEQQSYEKEDDR